MYHDDVIMIIGASLKYIRKLIGASLSEPNTSHGNAAFSRYYYYRC